MTNVDALTQAVASLEKTAQAVVDQIKAGPGPGPGPDQAAVDALTKRVQDAEAKLAGVETPGPAPTPVVSAPSSTTSDPSPSAGSPVAWTPTNELKP